MHCGEFADQVAAKPAAGIATFGVVTTWEGGTRKRARTMPLVLGDTALACGFVIDADEPAELLGTDTAANPQELILAALNACMTAESHCLKRQASASRAVAM